METISKIYLTAALVLDMAMCRYCYDTYGLSPDYNFFKPMPVSAPVIAQSSQKAVFYSNYAGTGFDNAVSAMAVMDDSVSSGAIYSDYRSGLYKKIYADNTRVQIPCDTAMLDKKLELDVNIDYAGDDRSGILKAGDESIAAVRIKNGMIYRISSINEKLVIDGFGVGSELSKLIRRWGSPVAQEDDRVYYFNVGDMAKITVVSSWEGYVTWILYEGLKTEIVDNDKNISVTEKDAVGKKETHNYPVADSVLSEHGKRHNIKTIVLKDEHIERESKEEQET